ncbi:MAG: aldehyde oxidase, partial [Candidatus Cloacimonetes bacterium]|nr:aldehyde oxidase [Candidatus Cloacimonadota bacterium]
TQIKPDEILTAIIIPKLPDKRYYHSYFKLGRRNAMNIARLSLCVMISFDKKENIKECFLVAGSLLNRPQRLTEIEEILVGQPLTDSIINEIDDPLKKIIKTEIGTRWSAVYKMPVFINLCKDALDEIKIQKSIMSSL